MGIIAPVMVLSAPDVKFAREPLASLLSSGLEAMLRAHWEEVAHDKDEIELAPDWGRYFRQESDGAFMAWGLRKAGALIGYTAFFVTHSLHYRKNIFALNDVIYVAPEHRGIDGLVMVLEAEAQLKARGITKVFYHTKTDAFLGETDDSLGALERLMDLEDAYGVKIPEDMPVGAATLGEVLAALGYRHLENSLGKML